MGKKGSTWNILQQKVFLQDSDQNFFREQYYIKSPKKSLKGNIPKTGLIIND